MTEAEIEDLYHHGLCIDLFAGGGGFSLGFEQGMKRPIDIALNHDRYAITLHAMNHPKTRHVCQDITKADPLEITQGKPVFWVHASPACTQFSRSRRALPAEKQLRELGWDAFRWVEQTRPAIFTAENVPEYVNWGPLGQDNYPIRERAGETWNEWVQAFRDHGYAIEWRILNSADHGAPTSRQRLIIIARRDGLPVRWPEADHGNGRAKPYEPAYRHIDWNERAPSIFNRKRALAPKTLERIRRGVLKHVIENPAPFNAPIAPQVDNDNSIQVAAFMGQNHGLLSGRSIEEPVSTICSKGAGQALITLSYIDVARKDSVGRDMRSTVPTITTKAGHFAEVRITAFLAGYYSEGGSQINNVKNPIPTITTRDRFGLAEVTIAGRPARIVDIGYRMLTVDELWDLMGFPRTYHRNIIANGKPLTQERQKRMIGNAVVPILARRVVEANLADIRAMERPHAIAA